MEERLAFDLLKYPVFSGANHRNPNAFSPVAADLASLAIEASVNKPLHERINPIRLTLTRDGRVVDKSIGDKDVSEQYSDLTEFDRREKRAGLIIRENLINLPMGTISVWISPSRPGLYGEARIVAGVNSYIDSDGFREFTGYGIVTDLPPEALLGIAKRLESATGGARRLNSPEDLRDKVFTLVTTTLKPWELLSFYIPLTEVWSAIAYGRADKNKEKARRDAEDAVVMMLDQSSLEDLHDMKLTGSVLELAMIGKGYGLASGPCGKLNKDRETGPETIQQIIEGMKQASVRVADMLNSRSSDENFVKSCPHCGAQINSKIRKGYRCTCGGVYAAVC